MGLGLENQYWRLNKRGVDIQSWIHYLRGVVIVWNGYHLPKFHLTGELVVIVGWKLKIWNLEYINVIDKV